MESRRHDALAKAGIIALLLWIGYQAIRFPAVESRSWLVFAGLMLYLVFSAALMTVAFGLSRLLMADPKTAPARFGLGVLLVAGAVLGMGFGQEALFDTTSLRAQGYRGGALSLAGAILAAWFISSWLADRLERRHGTGSPESPRQVN